MCVEWCKCVCKCASVQVCNCTGVQVSKVSKCVYAKFVRVGAIPCKGVQRCAKECRCVLHVSESVFKCVQVQV